MLLNERAQFDLARRLRDNGAPIGEVFSFMSGLYFRGKLAYATRFARPAAGVAGAMVIAPGEGLVPVRTPIDSRRLADLANVPVDLMNPRYQVSLERSCIELAERLESDCAVVLLGSIATDKYVRVLAAAFGERLTFPAEFIGRGDMSRGGLLLRCVDESRELTYIRLNGAARRGTRPPKLEPRRWT